MSPEQAARVSDPAVRALIEGARARGRFDAQAALGECLPEIRDAVARALLSDEFATDETKKSEKIFQEILDELSAPDDLRSLFAERQTAIEQGERERVERLNAKIRFIQLQGRAQGETSR